MGEKVACPGLRTKPLATFNPAIIRELYLELLLTGSHHHFARFLQEGAVLEGIEKLAIKTRDPLTKEHFEGLARPSFTSNTIEQLSISPFPFVNVAIESDEMAWFNGSSLKSLSLTGLTLEAGRSIGNADETLLNIVGRFPNLECLNIDKEMIQPSTLAKIVSTTRVRSIYHLSGYLMEEARLWAAEKHAARIIHGYRPSPAQLPDRPFVRNRLAQSLRRPRDW